MIAAAMVQRFQHAGRADDSTLYVGDRSAFARTLSGGVGVSTAADELATPDRELWHALGGPAAIETRWAQGPGDGFWRRVYALESVSRSQLDALGEATATALELPGPIAAVAGTGKRFHGQRERLWVAHPGNLHLSVAIPVEAFPARAALSFTLLPAVALLEAIEATSQGRARPCIKWVNDLLLAGRKVAGVLTRTRVQGGSTDLVLLGLGVNVSTAPDIRPTPFVRAAGVVPDVALSDLLRQTLSALAGRHRQLIADGIGPLLSAYRDASGLGGRRVRVYAEGVDETAPPGAWPDPVAAGVVVEILDDLSLRIEGTAEPVTKGRLAFEEDCRAYGLPGM